MKPLPQTILACFAVIFALSISNVAHSQVSYDDVVKGAIKQNNTQPTQNSINNNPRYDGNYNGIYTPPAPPERTTRQQSEYDNTPAASRYRATQQRQQLSANNPDAAYEAVKRAQPYGYKRKMRDLDDYSISEDDIRDASTDGVIDVNKIPDSRPTARSSEPLGELCCPIGTSYYLGICTRVTINRNISTAQYSEYSPGSKVPGGVCQGYKPIPGAVVVNN